VYDGSGNQLLLWNGDALDMLECDELSGL
jgi:hypothetical protein